MLSNAYFLAKFRFDTAENEPAKNLQNFRKMHFSKMHFSKMHFFENAFFERVGNRERGLQSQQRETKKERDAWGSFTKDEEVSQG